VPTGRLVPAKTKLMAMNKWNNYGSDLHHYVLGGAGKYDNEEALHVPLWSVVGKEGRRWINCERITS